VRKNNIDFRIVLYHVRVVKLHFTFYLLNRSRFHPLTIRGLFIHARYIVSIAGVNVNLAIVASSVFINKNFLVLLINLVALGMSAIHSRYADID